MKVKKGYDFDDLLLIPRKSSVDSREDVDLGAGYMHLYLKIPIICSPMKGISSPTLINKLGELGGMGILHRFHKSQGSWLRSLEDIDKSIPFGVAFGAEINEIRLRMALDRGAKVICIDIANGYIDILLDAVTSLRNLIINNNYQTLLMAGNVATHAGARDLFNAGCDMVRVGIGSGALCTTRNVTGIGVPQLTAIEKCSTIPGAVVADGGIRTSGDIVKALAMGADYVMIGTLFGHAEEADNDGVIFGMASRRLQEEYYHATKSIEGIERSTGRKVPLETIVDELVWGMKSAYTYLGAENTQQLRNNAEWIEAGRGTIKDLTNGWSYGTI